MYGAYLSYAQLKEYLAAAIQNGLLQPVDDHHIDAAESLDDKTTAKGMHFLKAYDQIGSMITRYCRGITIDAWPKASAGQ
jgi:predicted transcriptional regulator